MQINKPTSRKKIIIVSICMLIVGVAAVATVLYLKSGTPKKDADSTKEQQKSAGDQTKSNAVDASSGKSAANDTPPTPQPIENSSKSNVGVTMTASAQNGSMYQMRFQIDAPTNEGTCTLTLTKGASTVTKTATVQALAKISTCQGFDVPVSELSTGQWTVSLSYESDTLTGSTTSTITVQ
jgi:hypothetical protein